MKKFLRFYTASILLAFSGFCFGAAGELFNYNPGLTHGSITVSLPSVEKYSDSYVLGEARKAKAEKKDYKIILEYYERLKSGDFSDAVKLLSDKDSSRSEALNDFVEFSHQRAGFSKSENVVFTESFNWGIYKVFNVRLSGGGRTVEFFEPSICTKSGCFPSTYFMRGGEDVRLFGMLMRARQLSGSKSNISKAKLLKESEFVGRFLPVGQKFNPGKKQFPIEVYVDIQSVKKGERDMYYSSIDAIKKNLAGVDIGIDAKDFSGLLGGKIAGYENFYVRVNSYLDGKHEKFYSFAPAAFFNQIKNSNDPEIFGYLAYDDLAYVYVTLNKNEKANRAENISDDKRDNFVEEKQHNSHGKTNLLQVFVMDRKTGKIYLNLSRDITYLLLTDNIMTVPYRKYMEAR